MAHAGSMHDAFLHELKDMYDAEHQITKALPKMVKAATAPDLRHAFESHLEQTKMHMSRLEQVFASLQVAPKGIHCDGMAGILDEGASAIKADLDEPTRNATLIAAAQRVEHYEMAVYGTLVAWARSMGHQTAANLLQMTLDEEKATDEKLSSLAESGINQRAAAAAHA